MDKTHITKIIEALPSYKNHTDLLLRTFQQARLSSSSDNLKIRDDIGCKKCQIPWDLGQFTLKMKASNYKRKNRQKFRIERLQKELKSFKKTDSAAKVIRRKVIRLQKQTNHLAIYTCFCNTTKTKVQLWKQLQDRNKEKEKDVGGNKQNFAEVVTAAITQPSTDKHEPVVTKPKKKNKRKKTAGLLLPISRSESMSTNRQKSTNINFSKLSKIFSEQNDVTKPISKLNQFFK